MRKTIKRIARISGIILLVLVAAALLIPLLFKKQITAAVKKEINQRIVATVEFSDVSLSFFRHFPRLSLSIDELSVVGRDAFAGDTLLSTKRLDASVNLFSLIGGEDIRVSGVALNTPRIHALVNSEGRANWDIMKEDSATLDTTASSPSSFRLTLKEYELKDGYLLYRDEASGIFTEIKGVNHSGSGDLTEEIFTLATSTSIDQATFTYQSIPYLIDTKTTINSDIRIDQGTNTYTFRTDDIEVNSLRLNAEGFFQLVNDSTYAMDIKFRTPSNDFRDILSLVPGIYKQDFNSIKTGGKAAFEGFVKGTYAPTELPAYDVKLKVTDGFFQYPDLPKPVKNIQVDLHAHNRDGALDNTVIDIAKGHLEMDQEPFDFRFLFKNPETARYVDMQAKGKLDLANLSKFVKLENGTKLAGLVWSDVFAKGNLAAIEQYSGPFEAGGFFDISNLYFSSTTFPQPIQNGDVKLEITNQSGNADNTTIDIRSAHIEVGNDPVDFSLKIKNPVSTLDFEGKARGKFTLGNISQFTKLEEGTTISGGLNGDLSFSGSKQAIDKEAYDKILINGTASLQEVKYASKEYPGGVNIGKANMAFRQKTIDLSEFSASYLNTNFSATGSFNNLIGYALQDQPLSGSMDVSADRLNLDDWMATSPTPGAEPAPTAPPATNSSPFIVPGSLDISLKAKANQVLYDDVAYNDVRGELQIRDQAVQLKDISTNALGGSILINGSYSTKVNKTEPSINLSYKVNELDIQKTFLAYNTVRSLMPIGKFIAGTLTSELAMSGNLAADMMPDLKTLAGKGNLLLLNGVLQKFAPLEKLASTLSIDRLKSITVRDIKSYIEFANGTVLVKPFTIKVDDIEMQVGGRHGLDQSMDYIIAMKVPRSYLGNAGNNLVNGLVKKAGDKGVPIQLGETVNLNVRMLGSITNPTVQVDLKEVADDAISDLKQQVADFARAKADSARERIKDSIDSKKKEVVNDLRDKLQDKIFGKDTSTISKDSSKPRPVDKLKKSIGDMLKKK